jgi:putative flavoprotein involved in K+ transport
MIIVIGGGQAGLAAGYHLARAGRPFTILEAAAEPAAAWRARWDSLRLFTPARYSSLPGRPFPGDPDHYPTRDEVVDYLTEYARDLPVEYDSRVIAVHPGLEVELADRTLHADHVIVATGPFQVPRAASFPVGVPQLHSTEYRNPGSVPEGRVLVVGGGNTGFQIAEELTATHEVHLAVGSRQPRLPQRILGVDLFRYLEALGVMRITADSRLGRRLKQRETLIGPTPRGLTLHGRAIGATGSTVHFEDGELDVDAVIWATGFTRDHSWIHADVHYLGMPWQRTRGSALLGWVGDDAERLVAGLYGRSEAGTPPPRVAA